MMIEIPIPDDQVTRLVERDAEARGFNRGWHMGASYWWVSFFCGLALGGMWGYLWALAWTR